MSCTSNIKVDSGYLLMGISRFAEDGVDDFLGITSMRSMSIMGRLRKAAIEA